MSTLEPNLTSFDERVLAALDTWPRGSVDAAAVQWRNAWQVGEAIREYDVQAVRETLDGLVRTGRAICNRHWDHRRAWVARDKDVT